MHYHLEVVMPPRDDVQKAIEEILAPFSEDDADSEDGCRPSHAFWGYWVIGGRWSGRKIMTKLGEDRIKAFRASLVEKHVTVSGMQFGKPTLHPASQHDVVDSLWREMFPDSGINECPLFDHYKGDVGDVMRLSDIPDPMTCEHVIVAGRSYDSEDLVAALMLRDSIWNGVTWQKTAWDGTVSSALQKLSKDLEWCGQDYQERMRPTSDWLVATVDYHS